MLTIQTHGIPSIDTEWGTLSEAQNLLLTDSAPIRICGAPTGSGKTYAFIQAAKNGSFILFVVPTQALAKDIEESARKEGILAYTWDGRQSEDFKKKGQDLWSVRKEEIDHLKNKGGMLITTPETLQMVCFGKRQQYERIPIGILDLLSVRHIVFDEAHTLSVRAFGFLHFWAVLAVHWSLVDPKCQGVKLTWLSATHSNLFNGFFDEEKEEDSYIPRKFVSFFDEKIENGHREGLRMLHGNVDINIEDGNIMDCVKEHARAVLENGERLMILYDSLRQLALDEEEMCQVLGKIGVHPEEVFLVNGQDKKAGGHSTGKSRFEAGLVPEEKHRVIIATSCIEAGVNIKNLRCAILDPGLDAAALLQRIGRVARGNIEGKVWITTPRVIPSHFEVMKDIQKTVTISELSQELSPLRELSVKHAKRLGSAYWSMLKRTRKEIYEELEKVHQQISGIKTPGGHLNSLWAEMKSLPRDRDTPNYEKWLKGIDRNLSDLRGFSPSVLIRFKDSNNFEYSYDWAKAYLETPDDICEIEGKDLWIYNGFRNKYLRECPRKTNITLLCPNGDLFSRDYYPGGSSLRLIKDYTEKIKQSAKNESGKKREFMEKSAKFVESTGIVVREEAKDNEIL